MQNRNSQSPLPSFMADSFPVSMLSNVYSSFVNRRNDRYSSRPTLSYRLPFPVISVGGIRAGGTGKTPSALLIGEMLSNLNREVVFLSRGYKKPNKGNFIAKPGQIISWRDSGDEPAMLYRSVPNSWLGIGANRLENAKKICSISSEKLIFVLDDGFQHRKIKRDLDIVCLNETVFEDKLIPSGFLREPVNSLNRADTVFLIGTRDTSSMLHELQEKIASRFPKLDIYILFQEVAGFVNLKTGAICDSLDIPNPVALCGIARPERFFSTLKSQNIFPCKEISFSDHHQFTLRDFLHIHKLYSSGIVLTEKDAIRLTEITQHITDEIWFLRVRLKFQSNALSERFIRKIQSIISSVSI
jgi:tetraacyldisaccharide 4'-kinase